MENWSKGIIEITFLKCLKKKKIIVVMTLKNVEALSSILHLQN